MRIYTGGGRIIWKVTRTGSNEDQVAALTDQSVVIWSPAADEPQQVLPAVNEGRVHSDLVASPDGAWMASHGSGKLWVWRETPGGWVPHTEEADPGLCAAQFTAPGVLDRVALRDTKAGPVELHYLRRELSPTRKPQDETLAVFPAPDIVRSSDVLTRLHYYTVDLSADGRLFLFSAGERDQYVWDTRDGRLLGSVRMRSLPNAGAISPDGSVFAIDSGTTVYIYRVSNLELLGTWKVKHSYSPDLAWSPDGRRLARADDSTTVRVFDWAGGTEESALSVRGHRATAISYAPDGLTYLVGTFKGNVLVWDAE